MKINFDQKLKEDLLNGDQEAFTQTVEICKEFVYASAMGIVRNNHDAEDITQDVFTLLYKKRESIKPESNIPVWLYTSSVFISKKLLRNRSTHLKHEKEIKPMNKENSSSDELTEIVMEELSCLSLKYRDVLFRHYVLGEKYKEIAVHMGVNLSTVAMQIKRGVSKLKNNLSKKGYAVSSIVIIGIFTNPESAFANCSMSSGSIASSSKPLKIYASSNDSSAFQAFSSPTLDKSIFPKIISAVLLTSVFVIAYYVYISDLIIEQTPNAITDNPLEKFEIKLWNHQQNNLSELNSTNNVPIHKTHAKTNIQYLGTKKEIAYIPIPINIPSTPIKITVQLEHKMKQKGITGSTLVKGFSIPAFNKWFKASALNRTDRKVTNEFYLINNTQLVFTNIELVSIRKYDFKVENHQLCLDIQNIELYEIKVEKLTEAETSKILEIISKYKNKPTQHFEPQILPH